MRRVFLAVTLLTLVALDFPYTGAQNTEEKLPLTETPKFSSHSLLDASKLNLSHSYSFYYLSGSKGGFSFGVYTATLDYPISSSLRLRLGLSCLNQPLSLLGHKGKFDIKQSILPSFDLRYQPNEKILLQIDFSTLPNPYLFQTE